MSISSQRLKKLVDKRLKRTMIASVGHILLTNNYSIDMNWTLEEKSIFCFIPCQMLSKVFLYLIRQMEIERIAMSLSKIWQRWCSEKLWYENTLAGYGWLFDVLISSPFKIIYFNLKWSLWERIYETVYS